MLMNNVIRKRGKIQRKVVTSILLVGTIPGVLVVILTYLSGINALKNSIGANFQEMAKETADKIEIIMDREIQDAQSLALSPYIKDIVLKANKSYKEKDSKAPLGDKILNNNLTNYLKEYQNEKMKGYGSILITDIKGAVISATDKLQDYNEGEKNWWNTTFNQGKGKVFISGIDYNEGTQTYSVAVAVPIFDHGHENAIGVLKMVHDVQDIFKTITNIKIGETGHANLVTSDGTLVVCPIFPPKSHRINDELMEQISTDKPNWGIAVDDAHGSNNSIIGFAPVNSTFKMGKDNFGGKAWYIFIRQLPEETYAPMYTLLWEVSFLGIALVVVLSLTGFYAARRIVKPIGLLTEGAELIGRGRLEHHIDVKTNDEIEQLAEAFNQMSDNLEKSGKERERYLHQIEESEEHYKTLFDHAEDSMLMVDLSGKIIAVNKREEKVLGYSKDALLNQGFSRLLSEKHRDKFSHIFNDAINGKKPSTIEVEVLSVERGLLTMEMDMTGIKKGERISFVQIHLRDITERKILEKQINLERDKLETIIESMGDGMDIVDKDFRIQFMNKKFLRLFGDEAVGRTCYEVYMGRKKPCDECPVVKGIEKIDILEVNAPQGQAFLITHSPFKNIDGTTSILEIFKDITERKKLEGAIKESEEQYKNLFDHAEDSMLMIDLSGRIIAVNKRQEEIIGYSHETLLNHGFSIILTSNGIKDTYDDLFRMTLEGEKPPTTEVRILNKRGEMLTMEMSLTGIKREDKIAFVLIHLRDITKRKELEQQLLRSERLAAIGHFSSTLAHDLRNPVVGIKKRLESIQGTIGITDHETTKRILTDIILSSELLLGMVNDVLDVYQQSYEELPLIISSFSIVDALEEAIKLLQVEAEERRISVEINNRNESIAIQGDKRRLQRVFINLIDNAIKFSPTGGRVDIIFKPAAEDEVDYLLLKIEDEGPGIPSSELSRIFEPFYRKERKKEGKTGTGLGLYFCRIVVEAHQGKIWAENRNGNGAALFIKVPIGEREGGY